MLLEDELDELLLELLLVLELDEDASALPPGGGPGGGPPAPPGPPGPPAPPAPPEPPCPPAPPGPLAKVLLKTFCSSVACALVSLPFETSPEIRSLIFCCISCGDGGPLLVLLLLLELELLELLDWLWLLSAELMSSSADDSAVSSVELMVPEDTSDLSSFCSICCGVK